jgi:hypothetical protein
LYSKIETCVSDLKTRHDFVEHKIVWHEIWPQEERVHFKEKATSARGNDKYNKGILYQANSNLIFVKGTNRRKSDDPISFKSVDSEGENEMQFDWLTRTYKKLTLLESAPIYSLNKFELKERLL